MQRACVCVCVCVLVQVGGPECCVSIYNITSDIVSIINVRMPMAFTSSTGFEWLMFNVMCVCVYGKFGENSFIKCELYKWLAYSIARAFARVVKADAHSAMLAHTNWRARALQICLLNFVVWSRAATFGCMREWLVGCERARSTHNIIIENKQHATICMAQHISLRERPTQLSCALHGI